MIGKLIDSMEIDQLLDYGCGRYHALTNTLHPNRDFTYQAYDPEVPEFSSEPVPSEMVVCLDFLSTLNQWEVDGVLDDLERLTQHVLFCTIETVKQPFVWWAPRLFERFDTQRIQVISDQKFCFIAYALDCHRIQFPTISH